MAILHFIRYYILKSLFCYLLKIKCVISDPISAALFLPMHFWEEDGVGEFALF